MSFFKRVHFENDGKLSEEDVEECLLRETQALCIVNTKKKAQKIYNAMREDGVLSFIYEHVSKT